MAIFKKRGNNLSRAGGILEGLATKSTDTPPVDAPPVDVPPVDKDTSPVDTPPVDVPPVDIDTPPADVSPVDTPPADKDTPPVDTPPVDVPPVDVPPVDIPPVLEITDDLIFNKLSETLGREVKSYDDLKPNEVDPELAQLLEWKEKTGLSLSEWSNYNRDFSKMGDMDVAREILAKKYPNFTQEELNYSLKDFIYNETDDDESDKIKKSIALKKYAKEGRDSLEANRLELVSNKPKAILTQEQQDAVTFSEQHKVQTQSAKQQQDLYNAGIAQASNSLDSIDLKLSDDLTIKYNMPVEVKNGLPKMVAEMPHWYNKDGTYNHTNVVSDVAKVTNFEAMVEAAYKQGVAVGTEGRIKVGANITIDGTIPEGSTEEVKGDIREVVDSLTGGNKSKLRFRKKK